jgi:hypothetical protein
MNLGLAYSTYGLHVLSNMPIPGLEASPVRSETDLEIRFGSVPDWCSGALRALRQPSYISPYRDEQGEPVYRRWSLDGGTYFRILFCDQTEFIVDRAGTQIWAQWPDRLTLDDTATYLLGPILGFVLGLRGTHCLHASVISTEDRAVALLGPAGAGKSTTAAAFAKRGYSVLSDDVAAVLDQDGRFLIQPAYPRIRLWPSSVEALFGSPEALPPITPTWDKRHLDLSAVGYRFQAQPLPLAAVYLLAPRTSEPTAPNVEPMAGRDALMALVGNMYASHVLACEFQIQAFMMASRLLRSVALRRVTPHDNPTQISRLCDVIFDDLRMLSISRR